MHASNCGYAPPSYIALALLVNFPLRCFASSHPFHVLLSILHSAEPGGEAVMDPLSCGCKISLLY